MSKGEQKFSVAEQKLMAQLRAVFQRALGECTKQGMQAPYAFRLFSPNGVTLEGSISADLKTEFSSEEDDVSRMEFPVTLILRDENGKDLEVTITAKTSH